eukprot:UN34524
MKKCEYLKNELGCDDAINYKNTKGKQWYKKFKKTCPKGIDIYFDNVGGEILEMALLSLNQYGRIVLCGGISQYHLPWHKQAGPRSYLNLISK